jgi:hypothetical protein
MILTEPALASTRHEQLLLAGAHGPIAHLLLDDLQPFGYLRLIGCGAVAPQQELAHVRRHRVLPLEYAGQVLADD